MVETKILIVDDYIIPSMSRLLKLWGYELCEQVSSGEEAVKKVEQEKPNIVLMDINLNGEMNGIEAARQICSCFSVPIIFTTVYSDDKTREAAKIAEPVGYFVKPLDFYKLRTTINSVTRKDK